MSGSSSCEEGAGITPLALPLVEAVHPWLSSPRRAAVSETFGARLVPRQGAEEFIRRSKTYDYILVAASSTLHATEPNFPVLLQVALLPESDPVPPEQVSVTSGCKLLSSTCFLSAIRPRTVLLQYAILQPRNSASLRYAQAVGKLLCVTQAFIPI